MRNKLLVWTIALSVAVTMCGIPAVALASDEAKVVKEETVYVVTDSDGAQNDVIVSDHLINNGELQYISDVTDLSGIENVKGNEKYSLTGEDLTWKAKGNDIYYQGKSAGQVPISLKVSYTLNGKTVSGEELKGQSGDVVIDIEYKNSTGADGSFVPFVAMTGMLITDDSLTNIKVDNGKIIDDGDRQIVVGLAAPGLSHELGMGDNELGIGDSIKITGKARDFSVEDMMTVVTNSLFDEINTDKFEAMNMDDQIEELDNGSKELVRGSSQLYAGLHKLNAGTPALKSGVEQLHEGARSLTDNVDSTFSAMEEGAARLEAGENQLAAGLKQIQQSIGNTPETGQPQTIYGALRQIQHLVSQIKGSLNDGVDESNGILSDAGEHIDSAKTAIKEAEDLNEGRNESADKSSTDAAISDLREISGELESKGDTDSAKRINAVISSLEASHADGNEENNAAIKEKLAKAYEDMGAAEEKIKGSARIIAGAEAKAAKGSDSAMDMVIDALDKLMVKTEYLYESFEYQSKAEPGINAAMQNIINGTDSLLAGIKTANNKMGLSVYTGAASLANYLGELGDQSDVLIQGAGQLDKGANSINNGMKKLYDEGIKKIVDLYNSDIKGAISSIDDMIRAGQEYKSFTRLADDMDGSVKFIYKTTVAE